MRILIKYILISMSEKKGRLLLLIGSIGISVSLLIGALSASDTLSEMLFEQMKGEYGEYDIRIRLSEQDEEFLFDEEFLLECKYNKVFRNITVNGFVGESQLVKFIGIPPQDFENLSNIELLQCLDGGTDGVFISERISSLLNLNIGDIITIQMLGRNNQYKISGVCSNTGLFSTDTEKMFTIMGNVEDIQEYYAVTDNCYSEILLETRADNITAWVNEFNNKVSDSSLIAEMILDREAISGKMDWLRNTLYFMLSIILFMTFFIISTTFKLIINDRISIIGTFLSQGATNQLITFLFVIEACIYGLLGGVTGCIGGLVSTKVIADLANPLSDYGIPAKLELNPLYFLFGIVFALIISVFSVYVPIRKLKNMQIKNIILNVFYIDKSDFKGRKITGVVCLAIAFIFHFINAKYSYCFAVPGLILFFSGLVLVIPFIVEVISRHIKKIVYGMNINFVLALNNIQMYALLKFTIILFSFCIITIILMLSLGQSVLHAINTAYSQMYYDINVSMESKNYKEVEAVLSKYQNSTDIEKIIEISEIQTSLEGNAGEIVNVISVDPSSYIQFEDYMRYENKQKQFIELNNNADGIILAKSIASKYGFEIGDKITLMKDHEEVVLNILSIVDVRMFASGNYNLISKEAAKKHFGVNYASDYYLIQNKDSKDLINQLEQQLKMFGVNILTKNEIIQEQKNDIKRLVDILNFITGLIVCIASISCISNISINFAQRRKEFAVLHSVGMESIGIIQMLTFESLIQTVLSCAIAFISSVMVGYLTNDVYRFFDMDLSFKFSWWYTSVIFILSILLTLSFNIFTIMKIRKLNVIQDIKYE